MILQNVYTKNKSTGETLWTGIRLLKLAPSRRHHFYPRTLAPLLERGFATVNSDVLTLNTVEGVKEFTIDHQPGTFCLHCKWSHELDGLDFPQGHPQRGAAARAHVKENHAKVKSPNVSYPAGYKRKEYIGVTASEEIPDVHPNAVRILNRSAAVRG